METTRLSTKGQIVVPKSIRLAKAWKPGTEFTVEETREGILLKPANALVIWPTTLDEVMGYLGRVSKAAGKKLKPLTVEEMDEAIAAEVTRRHVRSRY